MAALPAHTVREVVREMLRRSDNLDAEYLDRLTARAGGAPATWSGGATVQRRILSRLGVPMASVATWDGSGLSRADRSTSRSWRACWPSRLTRLTRTSRRSISRGRCLSVAGVSGTLAARYKRFTTAPASCARGKVLAKTGSLRDVVTLAGVTIARDGQVKVFAFLVNGRAQSLGVRQALDRLAATVTGCW